MSLMVRLSYCYVYINPYSTGDDFRRQILTSEVDPHTKTNENISQTNPSFFMIFNKKNQRFKSYGISLGSQSFLLIFIHIKMWIAVAIPILMWIKRIWFAKYSSTISQIAHFLQCWLKSWNEFWHFHRWCILPCKFISLLASHSSFVTCRPVLINIFSAMGKTHAPLVVNMDDTPTVSLRNQVWCTLAL